MNEDLIQSRYMPAALKALEHFPIVADSIELVAISENVTFRISVAGSDIDYVLRLHRPGYNSLEELESERIWTSALGDAGVVVQKSIASLSAGHYVLVDIPETDEQRYAGLTTWQSGKRLRDHLAIFPDADERVRLFRQMGTIAATTHNQSTAWEPPKGFTRRRLDIEALLGEEPFWGRFWEHCALTASERALLLDARKKAVASLERYGEHPDKFSLIHADFTPDNVIIDGETLALIDFDDSAYGWHLYDIASALVEYVFENDYETLQAAMLDGYRERRPLTDEDIAMLPDFLLVRGMAIIGWFHQRPEHDESTYFEENRRWVIENCMRRAT